MRAWKTQMSWNFLKIPFSLVNPEAEITTALFNCLFRGENFCHFAPVKMNY